jgi:hypothetical protein
LSITSANQSINQSINQSMCCHETVVNLQKPGHDDARHPWHPVYGGKDSDSTEDSVRNGEGSDWVPSERRAHNWEIDGNPRSSVSSPSHAHTLECIHSIILLRVLVAPVFQDSRPCRVNKQCPARELFVRSSRASAKGGTGLGKNTRKPPRGNASPQHYGHVYTDVQAQASRAHLK